VTRATAICDDPTMKADPSDVSNGAAASSARYRVREMQLAEVDIRISYFHDAADEHLPGVGARRADRRL
jgi:hypothetical protein